MGDTFVMSSRQAAELDHAFERNGWTAADVKKLSAGDTLAQVLHVVRGNGSVTIASRPYPTVGEVFELTLNGNDPTIDPVEMVRRDGYNDPERWRFTGARIAGEQARRFKLVEIGYQPNFDAVCSALKQHGEIPGGQWREVFKAAFGKPDGKGPIGFADPSWGDPHGSVGFPCVYAGGASVFRWADHDFHDDWRWLVGVSK